MTTEKSKRLRTATDGRLDGTDGLNAGGPGSGACQLPLGRGRVLSGNRKLPIGRLEAAGGAVVAGGIGKQAFFPIFDGNEAVPFTCYVLGHLYLTGHVVRHGMERNGFWPAQK